MQMKSGAQELVQSEMPARDVDDSEPRSRQARVVYKEAELESA